LNDPRRALTRLTSASWIGVTYLFPSTVVRTIQVNSTISPVLEPERYNCVLAR
jgi:hypothetical protein